MIVRSIGFRTPSSNSWLRILRVDRSKYKLWLGSRYRLSKYAIGSGKPAMFLFSGKNAFDFARGDFPSMQLTQLKNVRKKILLFLAKSGFCSI